MFLSSLLGKNYSRFLGERKQERELGFLLRGSLDFEEEEQKVWRNYQELTKFNLNMVGKMFFTIYFLVLAGLLWEDGKPLTSQILRFRTLFGNWVFCVKLMKLRIEYFVLNWWNWDKMCNNWNENINKFENNSREILH